MPLNCANGAASVAAVETEPPAPAVERTHVFLKHDSWWHDVGVQTAPAHATVTIPSRIAQIALAVGNALDPKSEVAQRLLAAFGCAYAKPQVDQCIDLAGTFNPDRAPKVLPIIGRRMRYR